MFIFSVCVECIAARGSFHPFPCHINEEVLSSSEFLFSLLGPSGAASCLMKIFLWKCAQKHTFHEENILNSNNREILEGTPHAFRSLLHLVTCPLKGLLIRNVCEINVYILDGLGMCSTSI